MRPLNGGGYEQVEQQQDYGQGYSPQGHHENDTRRQGGGDADPRHDMRHAVNPTTNLGNIFFAAACCVTAVSLIGAIVVFVEGDLLQCLDLIYMALFGLVLAITDTPYFKQLKIVSEGRMYIGKFVHILTRLTGKGLAFLFVGCTVTATLWNNVWNGFMLFLTVICGFTPIVVGIAAIFVGVIKSLKLKKARNQLKTGALEQRFEVYAQTFKGPGGGLTPAEFNALTIENGCSGWEQADLQLIFNALVSNPSWRMQGPTQGANGEPHIPREDMVSWVRDEFLCGMVWL